MDEMIYRMTATKQGVAEERGELATLDCVLDRENEPEKEHQHEKR